MPATFNTSVHLLEEAGPDWDPEIRKQHEANRSAVIAALRRAHGEANVEQAVANLRDLGPDPASVLGWHNFLWLDVRHAFVSGCYYAAATGAGSLGERILQHMLVDLAPACGTAEERGRIEGGKSIRTYDVIGILEGWDVFEPGAHDLFDRLRILRNSLVHFDPDLYEHLRKRSLEAVKLLRDAIEVQFGVFSRRRLIEGTPGAMYLKKAVESEPFVREYMLRLAFYVGPRNTIEYHAPSDYWQIDTDPEVTAPEDTDEEFVRLLRGGD